MLKKRGPKEKPPSLYPDDWDKPKSPSFDPNFFKNFTIAVNDINNQPKNYYFKPWDEEQKHYINISLNILKSTLQEYINKKQDKSYTHVLFPDRDLKSKALSVLQAFFQPNNILLSENINDRLNRYQNIEKERQSSVQERRDQSEKILANIPKDNKKFWQAFDSLFGTFNRSENEKQLKSRAERDEYTEQRELGEEIIKKIFKHFFPTIVKFTDQKHHQIVLDQIKVFIDTIENTVNNII